MNYFKHKFFYSPSDLIDFMESPFASWMEKAKLLNKSIVNFIDPEDEMFKLLQNKGYQHEYDYLKDLENTGKKIYKISSSSRALMEKETLQAMKEGKEFIAQGYISMNEFSGFPDLLVKVDGISLLGSYHYEVWDIKLSGKMKPYFAIQLCCYSEMLKNVQGLLPLNISIVLGNKQQQVLKLNQYYNYYQSLKSSFLEFHQNFNSQLKPDPSSSREYGRWSKYAENLLKEQDHLLLVANITHNQVKVLQHSGIKTLKQLAQTQKNTLPKLDDSLFERLKIQSNLQIRSRKLEKPLYQILPPKNNFQGLSTLPPHSENDLFFDIEGYPLYDGGLEYLWGVTYFNETGIRKFRDFWAHDHEQEKHALIDFVNWVYPRWLSDRTMHVYHYASYEINALRKLMGRYGVCEQEIDTLLRNHVFVDLYKIVRNGILVGESSYSLKNIELLYRDSRQTDVKSGGDSILIYDEWRNAPDGWDYKTSKVLQRIREYNVDDCDSTQELTEWLRERQKEKQIEYITQNTSEEQEQTYTEDNDISRLRDKLLSDADYKIFENEKDLFKDLAWMLEFHKRENKPTWWRFFDRMGRNDDDLKDDMDCLVGLIRTNKKPYLPTSRSKNWVYEYKFNPDQPFKGQLNNFYVLGQDNIKAKTFNYLRDEGLIEIQSKKELPKTISLVPDEFINPSPIPEAIKCVINNLLDKGLPDCAITDFLRRRRPRLTSNLKGDLINFNLNGHEMIHEILEVTQSLDNSYLCIQGPPGSGKTYTAKHIIGKLLESGKRVGISSNSHSAIINLMKGVCNFVETKGIDANLIKAGGDKNDSVFLSSSIKHSSGPRDCYDDVNSPAVCIGGTAWFFCNALFDSTDNDKDFIPLDYLFIDEAGQVSIANLIGMSRACRNIIMMGDQMQLSQPIQGSHPGNTGQSILEYLLHDKSTIPSDLGIFLPKTYRMHQKICSVISDQVYDARLVSDDSTEKHVIEVSSQLIKQQSGICFIPVDHEGNTQGSEEEVEMIRSISEELIGSYFWPEKEGLKKRILEWNDILFVAPYNYQVNLLQKALGKKAKVGSVDLFQGQEAPVVIISMCSSDASESPRGIDFLFSKNRMNVALSRAQALAVVVGSSKLAKTKVSNLDQMSLVNFFNKICNI